jgi:FAD synthetase
VTEESRTTLGLILIGEELLSGKIDDSNGPYTIRKARNHGLKMREMACIGDDIDVIAETVRRFSDNYDIVVTSGGVGPTHDDLTMNGIARAFDVGMHTDDKIRAQIEERFGDDPEALRVWVRMARVPENCTSIYDEARLPIFVVENVHILPGVPQFFQHQLDVILEHRKDSPLKMRTLYIRLSEGQLAERLEAAGSKFPTVEIGSYPVYGHPDYKTRITIEHVESDQVKEAANWLSEQLDDRALHAVSDSDRLD